MFDVFELQCKLNQVAMPSGFEAPQAKLLAELAKPFVDEVYTDTLGNVICHKKGKGKKLMMPAHMDVIGFMATFIDQQGFVRFETIGGHAAYSLINMPIIFENGVRGCIRVDDSDHAPTASVSAYSVDRLYIDLGAADKAEAEKLIKIGYVARFDFAPEKLLGDNFMTPYADDLAACVVLLLAMEQLEQSENDLYFVFTVQEELGLRGAKVASNHIKPDMGIAIDLTRTGDSPGELKHERMVTTVGKGPAIKIKDSSLICNPQVVEHLRKAAKKAKVQCQTEILLAGGTDSAAMQLSGGGVPAGCISIPGRNIHSCGEIISAKDVVQAAKLLATAAATTIK